MAEFKFNEECKKVLEGYGFDFEQVAQKRGEAVDLYDPKFVHFDWDESLDNKFGFFSNTIETLKYLVRNNIKDFRCHAYRFNDKEHPFNRHGWNTPSKFFYYDPLYDVKWAYFKEGKTIQRKYKTKFDPEGCWHDLNTKYIYTLSDFDNGSEWYDFRIKESEVQTAAINIEVNIMPDKTKMTIKTKQELQKSKKKKSGYKFDAKFICDWDPSFKGKKGWVARNERDLEIMVRNNYKKLENSRIPSSYFDHGGYGTLSFNYRTGWVTAESEDCRDSGGEYIYYDPDFENYVESDSMTRFCGHQSAWDKEDFEVKKMVDSWKSMSREEILDAREYGPGY